MATFKKTTMSHKTPFSTMNQPIRICSKITLGQANSVYVFYPDKLPSLGKSLIVHIKAARILNVSFFEESNVCTPSYHNSLNSWIRGCK
uniref:Putative ovule protein n=1 Tax=Solanum chacoense TaxID=4108 RepID=A0A0V0GM53_SOLCH